MNGFKKPGIKHQNAMIEVKKRIEEEIGIIGKEEYNGIFNRLIPDLTFEDDKKNLMVVEIGNTDADKILKYMEYHSVIEIRWYSLDAKLVAIWNRKKGCWNTLLYFKRIPVDNQKRNRRTEIGFPTMRI